MAEWELAPHQKTAVKFGLNRPYCILALKQGLGKTLVALDIANRSSSKVLVICPSYLIPNWEEEIRKFFPEKIISVFDSAKKFYKVFDTDIVLVSYDLSGRFKYLFEWCDIIIMDEAHYIKDMETRRSENVHREVYEGAPKRMLLLTGTPIQNAVHEFYSLIALCYYHPSWGEEPPFLNKYPDFTTFADHFSKRIEFHRDVYSKGGQHSRVKCVKWEGLKNKEELKSWLKPIYLRMNDDVLDLPPLVFVPVYASRRSDPELWEAFINFNKDNSSTKSDIKAKVANEAAKFTIDYVRDLAETEDKIIIYTAHVDAAHTIAKALRVTPITGQMTPKKRKEIAGNFTHGTNRYLVATYAFSTGVTLIQSNNIVINDPPWVPGILEQAYYRIKRIGQTKTCYIHQIYTSIQTQKIYDSLAKKIETIKEAT